MTAMKPLFRLAASAALLLAVAPAAAQELEEPPPADGEPDVRLWKEACDLDGKKGAELYRVSGSSSGGSMSQGRETWRVQRGPTTLLELTQEGRPTAGAGAVVPEADRWTVTCSRGTIRIRAGDAELRLTVGAKGASVDAKWLAGLAPERARDLPLARLEGFAALLDGLEDEPAVAGADEGSARVGLLIAERAIDAGDTDRADAALQQAEAGRRPALAAWTKKVTARLDALRGAAPIRPVDPVALGTVARPVTIPVGRVGEGELRREPDVFWSGASLCVRQDGEKAGTMRCWEAGAGRWRAPEPYATPYAEGPKLKATYLGNAGGYATRISLEDAAGERVVAELQSPSLLARDVRGGLVIRAAGATAGRGDVAVYGYDAAAGVGSLLAGGGKYFFDGPTTLRSVAQAGRSWTIPAPGKDAGVACVSEPLTSPDEQRAACLAAKRGAPASPTDLELWVFELAEPGE